MYNLGKDKFRGDQIFVFFFTITAETKSNKNMLVLVYGIYLK